VLLLRVKRGFKELNRRGICAFRERYFWGRWLWSVASLCVFVQRNKLRRLDLRRWGVIGKDINKRIII